ncbi:MAG: helix-turn-helix transcriptional regulator [Sandaracinaceae bacterium]
MIGRAATEAMDHDDKGTVSTAPARGADALDAPAPAVEPAAPSPASSDRRSASTEARPHKGPGSHPNNVRRLRKERLMSQAELARRASLSVGTIDRVEKGYGCRMETKRKILTALGLTLGERAQVFPEVE